jgi:hypothetical protein
LFKEPKQQQTAEQDQDEYRSPDIKGDYFFVDHFDDLEEFNKRWVRSEAKKDDADEQIAKYDGMKIFFSFCCGKNLHCLNL